MAGHSHWKNIKHKKSANDAKRGAGISKVGKLVTVAVQIGGPDPDSNPRLRLAIAKARSAYMSMEAIQRAIKKAAGIAGEGKQYVDLMYEGYATDGIAVVVEALTDNRNRTGGEVRKLFERGGGAMGAPGCVAWQFKEKAFFQVTGANEDKIMEILMGADFDAEDIKAEDDAVTVTVKPEVADKVRTVLEGAGCTIAESQITYVSDTTIVINDLEKAKKIQKFLDVIEENDDVTAVHSNFVPAPEIADQM